MSVDDMPEWLNSSTDWRALLNHLDFEDGFSFAVVLVRSQRMADACMLALEDHLEGRGKRLLLVRINEPEDLVQLPVKLTEPYRTDSDAVPGPTWVSRVVPEESPDFTLWRTAWRQAVSKLNQFRNPLSRTATGPLIFVGAPWLKQVLREDAPDLWSIRSIVAEIDDRPIASQGTLSDDSLESEGFELDEAFESILSGQTKLSPNSRVRAVLREVRELLRNGDWDTSRKYLQRVLDTSESRQISTHAISEIYQLLGRIAAERAAFEEAANWYNKALTLLKEQGDQSDLARLYSRTAIVLTQQRHFSEAEALCRRALEVFERLGDLSGTARIYSQLGTLATLDGRFDEAKNSYLRSRALRERMGDLTGKAATSYQLGILAREQFDFEDARHWFLESLTLRQSNADLLGVSRTCYQLGLLAEQESQLEQAKNWYLRSLHAGEEQGDLRGIARSSLAIAVLERNTGNFRDARRWYLRSLSASESRGDTQRASAISAQLDDLSALERSWRHS